MIRGRDPEYTDCCKSFRDDRTMACGLTGKQLVPSHNSCNEAAGIFIIIR